MTTMSQLYLLVLMHYVAQVQLMVIFFVVNDSWFKRTDISNFKSFINDCEVAQKRIKDEYFETAIRSNITINPSTQSKVLTHFFDYNAQLTSAHKSELLRLKLVDFLFSRDIKRTFYLDQYHFDFLNSIFLRYQFLWTLEHKHLHYH